MGAKATFNSVTRIIKLTEAPSLIDGELVVELDVKIDLYGDQKEDWLANPTTLRKVRPPFSVIGGQTTPTGKAGNTFFQRSDWKIEPYDASHILRISGNLYSADGQSPFIVPSGGTYMVQIERVVSNIVDTVETGISGLTSSESSKLTETHAQVEANLKTIEGSDSHAMVMRVIRAALCGTAKDAVTDGPITENTTRIAYMSSDGSKPRLIFDVVNLYGTRTGATLDMSP